MTVCFCIQLKLFSGVLIVNIIALQHPKTVQFNNDKFFSKFKNKTSNAQNEPNQPSLAGKQPV